jgi:nucleoside-diphosphate-sugar epimerase
MMGALQALEACEAGNSEADFDVAIIRATPLYGYSSSYYSAAFDYMEAYTAAVSGKHGNILKFPQSPDTIMHGIHVDDCGDAYVALATTAIGDAAVTTTALNSDSIATGRSSIAGQAFNISSGQYETLRQVAAALAAEYGFIRGVQFNVEANELPSTLRAQDTSLVFGYSQWLSSDKIRAATGWSDMRPLFHQNVKVFRSAYNATMEMGSDNIRKTRQRMAGNWGD